MRDSNWVAVPRYKVSEVWNVVRVLGLDTYDGAPMQMGVTSVKPGDYYDEAIGKVDTGNLKKFRVEVLDR